MCIYIYSSVFWVMGVGSILYHSQYYFGTENHEQTEELFVKHTNKKCGGNMSPRFLHLIIEYHDSLICQNQRLNPFLCVILNCVILCIIYGQISV